MKNRSRLSLFILFLLPFFFLQAQDTPDTLQKEKKKGKPVLPDPLHRNVIKFNPTPMLLWSEVRNITLSYERLIKKNQSVAVQTGYLLFPNLVDDTIAGLIKIYEGDKSGINLAFDYRYYPFARNRRPAPDGMYIGGYMSYYGFQFSNKLDILYTNVDQQGTLEGRLNAVNLGFELGYQFIFWKRLSLDLLLFGPSLSYYQGYLDITGALDQEQIENINEELVDRLLEKYPLLGTLFSEETLHFTGNRWKFGTGFRYSVQVGFHF